MHWLESDGCCKAVVIENLIFVVVWRFFIMVKARFSPRQDPHPVLGLLLGAAIGTFVQYSDSKKYRQETLLSKVESEPSHNRTISHVNDRIVHGADRRWTNGISRRQAFEIAPQ
jgi:hypothetical protein